MQKRKNFFGSLKEPRAITCLLISRGQSGGNPKTPIHHLRPVVCESAFSRVERRKACFCRERSHFFFFFFWFRYFRRLSNQLLGKVRPRSIHQKCCHRSQCHPALKGDVSLGLLCNYCCIAPISISRIFSSPLLSISTRSLHPPIHSFPIKIRGTVLAPVSCCK